MARGRQKSEQFLELADAQTRVTHDRRHRVRVDGIIPWHDDSHRTLRQENVFALPIDVKPGLFQCLDCAQVIYARKLRHYSSRHYFHLANFAARFGLAIKIEVTADGVFDICERLFDGGAL